MMVSNITKMFQSAAGEERERREDEKLERGLQDAMENAMAKEVAGAPMSPYKEPLDVAKNMLTTIGKARDQHLKEVDDKQAQIAALQAQIDVHQNVISSCDAYIATSTDTKKMGAKANRFPEADADPPKKTQK